MHRRGVLDTSLCDKSLSVTCNRSVVFSGTPVSSTNKTDNHDIVEILLKMALNTTKPNQSNLPQGSHEGSLSTLQYTTVRGN